MFRRLSIEVTTPSGVTVDHRLIAHDDPRGLLIMLPGRGYTCDHPVLHFLRKAAADLGYDVLSVWYSFQVAPIRGRSGDDRAACRRSRSGHS